MFLFSHRILLEVGTSTGEDPVWAYFDSQHKHIISLMESTRTAYISRVEGKASYFGSVFDIDASFY